MQSYDRDKEAVWKPYFLTEEDENQVQEYETYDDTLYVAVRKGYEHPEIPAKYISVIFDYSRYDDGNANEVNEYFSLNVDPTARPMNINVDYKDALYRTTRHIREALEGEKEPEALSGLEKSQSLPLQGENPGPEEDLLKLEQQTFIQIICGEKPVGYFDTFVKEWYAAGGKEITQKARTAVKEEKES